MKKHTIFIAALLGAVLLGGCSKNPFSHKGELVTFGTFASGVQTRAAYGTDFTDSESGAVRQRIDWETGDVIRIVSDYARVANDGSNLAYADYTVTSASPEADGTSAAVVNTNPNGLCWVGADTYTFWGVYPSGTPISETGVVTANFIEATQTLPAADADTKTVGDITYTVHTPSLKKAVMTAVVTGVKENDDKPQVKLHFKPAWTAIEFNLSSQDDAIDITQVQLVADASSADVLAGPFTMTAGNLSSAAAADGASKTVTMAMENVSVTQTEGVTFTMFLLPIPNASALKLRLTSKEGEGEKTSVVSLTKNGAPFVLEAGKKYRINGFKAPGSSWKIFIATDIMNVDDWGEPIGTTLIVE